MISEETLARADAELAIAEKSRLSGFEGRARVSARRAAGIVIREYLHSQGTQGGSPSAYDLLQIMRSQPGLNPEIQQAIDYLLMRVDEDFQIPAQVDLIAETRRLIYHIVSLDTQQRPGE